MLYQSTKALLQSILVSLETGDESRWDGHAESGNTCLYEMHQMSGPLYRAYRTDAQNVTPGFQGGLPEKLNRAMPHVRLMVIAIRHKDRATAIESGTAALAEMNGIRISLPGARCTQQETSDVRQKPTVSDRDSLRPIRTRGKSGCK